MMFNLFWRFFNKSEVHEPSIEEIHQIRETNKKELKLDDEYLLENEVRIALNSEEGYYYETYYKQKDNKNER